MIRDVCTKPVVTISARATIQEAARLMRQKKVGALVVMGSDKPTGILTDRDIAMGVVAEGLDATQIPVGDIMRRNPTVIRDDKGVLDAVKTLGEKGIRRLPVVDKHGKLVGIVALDDLMLLLGSEMGHVAAALTRGLARPQMLT